MLSPLGLTCQSVRDPRSKAGRGGAKELLDCHLNYDLHQSLDHEGHFRFYENWEPGRGRCERSHHEG
jgi:hypothetical protein